MLTVVPCIAITGSIQMVVVILMAWLGAAKLSSAMIVSRAVACAVGQHLHARAFFNLLPLPSSSVPLSLISFWLE